MLFAVIAPFFTTYLIRTIAWETILSDDGLVVSSLQTVGILSETGRVLPTATAVIAGITYNFLPFMVLPLYASLERLDPRLIEAAKDLYASPAAGVPEGDPAALGARASSPAPCSRSSRPSATTSTPSSSAAPTTT